jgi:hypothetical protein
VTGSGASGADTAAIGTKNVHEHISDEELLD